MLLLPTYYTKMLTLFKCKKAAKRILNIVMFTLTTKATERISVLNTYHCAIHNLASSTNVYYQVHWVTDNASLLVYYARI